MGNLFFNKTKLNQMKQFVTVLALTASTAFAATKCGKTNCTGDFIEVDDPNESNSKYCICECKFISQGCAEGEELATEGCGCVATAPTCDKTCDEFWTLDAAACECKPAEGEDPCNERYEGKFSAADGSDCPAGDEEGSGAVAQAASMAVAIVAALLF